MVPGTEAARAKQTSTSNIAHDFLAVNTSFLTKKEFFKSVKNFFLFEYIYRHTHTNTQLLLLILLWEIKGNVSKEISLYKGQCIRPWNLNGGVTG